jgi:hypothetical protein
MTTVEYYKLKEELSELIKNQVSTDLRAERDLQQRYIGLGLKIAGAGAAVAILSVGLLGIKSTYDISSAISDTTKNIEKKIETEITSQFNERNPVRSYQSMLIGASARAIIASIDIQAAQNNRLAIQLDERIVEAVNAVLKSSEVKGDVKREVISVLVRTNIRDQGIRSTTTPLVLSLLKDISRSDHIEDVPLAIACIRYLALRTAPPITADIGRIYDQHKNERQIGLAVAQYAFELSRDNGERLITSLEASNDDAVKYLMHMRRLRFEKNTTVDGDLLKRLLPSTFEVNPAIASLRPTDVLRHIGSVFEDNENHATAVQLMDILRESAVSRNFEFAVSSAHFDGRELFGFVRRRGQLFGMPRQVFNEFFELAVSLFVKGIEENQGTVTSVDLARIAFWTPKNARGPKRANEELGFLGAIAVLPNEKMAFVTNDNAKIQRSDLDGRVMLRISNAARSCNSCSAGETPQENREQPG